MRHQRHNAGVPACVDDMGDELNQEGKNSFAHERSQYIGRIAEVRFCAALRPTRAQTDAMECTRLQLPLCYDED